MSKAVRTELLLKENPRMLDEFEGNLFCGMIWRRWCLIFNGHGPVSSYRGECKCRTERGVTPRKLKRRAIVLRTEQCMRQHAYIIAYCWAFITGNSHAKCYAMCIYGWWFSM